MLRHRRSIRPLLTLMLCVGSQKVEGRALTELLEGLRAEHDVPALAAAVAMDGEVIAVGAVGHRKRGAKERVTVDDRFHIGSCAKSMTATLIARVVEDGELRWDTKLATIFPERAESMHASFRAVTLRQLVDHRAGLPKNVTAGGLLNRIFPSTESARAARLRLLERTLAEEPSYEPGARRQYSNIGFVIAGAALERNTDRSWEELMRDELFLPLGMNSAGFGAPGAPGAPDRVDQPWGHLPGASEAAALEPGSALDRHAIWYGPAGDVHLNLTDWARFLCLHAGSAGTLLSDQSLRAMHTPVPGFDYACGFGVTDRAWAKGPVLAHMGASVGWSSAFSLSRADGLALMVACNQGGEEGERVCRAVVTRLAELYLGAEAR